MPLAHNFDLPINLPKPAVNTSTPKTKGFPPALASFKIPKIPPAVVKSYNAAVSLVTQATKLAGMVQNAAVNALKFANKAITSQTVTLIVKRGTTVIFKQKVSPLGPV